MADVADFDRLVSRENGLSVVSTLRADQTIQATVVNCGVLDHPARGVPVIGFTTRGNSRKLANLRARPRLTATVRAGWEWVTAEGHTELAGPDDPLDGLSPEGLPGPDARPGGGSCAGGVGGSCGGGSCGGGGSGC
jgi:hypothetical protein